jgi:hypothetical protein
MNEDRHRAGTGLFRSIQIAGWISLEMANTIVVRAGMFARCFAHLRLAPNWKLLADRKDSLVVTRVFSHNKDSTNKRSVPAKEDHVVNKSREELYAVIRVDTHGNRFVVRDCVTQETAKSIEKEYDCLPHHQGYYVVKQDKVKEELKRTS